MMYPCNEKAGAHVGHDTPAFRKHRSSYLKIHRQIDRASHRLAMRIQSRRKSPAIDRLDRRPVQSRTAGTARYRDRIDPAGGIDGDPHLHDPGRTIQHGSSGIIRLHIGYNRRRRDRDPALRTRSLTITLPLSAAFPFASSLPRRIAFPASRSVSRPRWRSSHFSARS